MSVQRAKELRLNSSAAERRMWRLLHVFRTDGFHFRKQVPIGPYYADIACHHARIVIEVDGDTHGTAAAARHDARRDAFLRRQGYVILRFANSDVLHNPDGVFQVVAGVLAGRPMNKRAGRQGTKQQ
jgi:very-short-patch-repair endonuclease